MEEFFFICRKYILKYFTKEGGNLKKQVFINMEKEIFRGNVLDIGLENYGIVYNIYKEYNDKVNVEYVNGKEEQEKIKENFYDSCIMLFSFSSLWFKKDKKKFIRDIYRYLAKDGLLYIWDIDKGYRKIFNSVIKILAPGRKLKKIKIKDLNIFKDSSRENSVKLLEEYFEILDLKASDGIYYIKAKKKSLVQQCTEDKRNEKGIEEKDESCVNSA